MLEINIHFMKMDGNGVSTYLADADPFFDTTTHVRAIEKALEQFKEDKDCRITKIDIRLIPPMAKVLKV